MRKLPEYCVSKKDAEAAGWVTWKGNLADVLIFASYDHYHTFCEITQ
jgi:hypothetical protein